MEHRGPLKQLRELQERLDLLHANLQKVSSKTLSNSRTVNLEDRVTQLEDRPIPSEPTHEPDIFEDVMNELSRQMGIFDQQLRTLENKTKDFLDFLDTKIDTCDKKVDTYQNDFFEWVAQWKADNLPNINALGAALASQQKQIDQILLHLQQKGIPIPESAQSSKPTLVHFPKWKPRSPRSPPAKRRSINSPRLHQSGAADE